jgi:hypothetical protein
MERTNFILRLLLEYARPIILEEFKTDSCIASTRIGLDVLDHYGILAEPLTVKTTIFNPVMLQRHESGERLPTNDAEMQEWVGKYRAWAIGLGFGGDQGPHKWPGHLVLHAEKTTMLDLSIDQANRPQWDISLHPFGTNTFPEFLAGDEPLYVVINGCLLKYHADLNNRGYTISPNWTLRLQRHRTVREIINKIDSELPS